MISRFSDTDVEPAPAKRSTWSDGAAYTQVTTTDRAASLARSALVFATHCHARQRRSGGALAIEHPLEVARLLRDAGCSAAVVAAGLLHDVIEHTDVSLIELKARFGAEVADLVEAVNDDDTCTASYRERKQVLREQVRVAGVDAALLFAADKICAVRDLPQRIERERARFGGTAQASRARARLDRYHEMRLEHYHESVAMLQRVSPRHPLVRRLASELEHCPVG